MKKKQVCTILALVASALFFGLYVLLFTQLGKKEESVVVIEEEENTQQTQTKKELSWIQLGVFKEESSYRDLWEFCQRENMNPVLIESEDNKIVVVGCDQGGGILETTLLKIQEMELDYMVKTQTFEDEKALQLLDQNQYKSLLEGYVYH